MTTIILYGVCFIAGIVLTYFLLRPAMKQKQTLDEHIIEQNKKASADLKEAENKLKTLNIDFNVETDKFTKLCNDIQAMQDTAQQRADDFYKKATEAVQQKLDLDQKNAKDTFDKAKADYADEYITVLKDMTTQFNDEQKKIIDAIANTKNQLEQYKATLSAEAELVSSAVAAKKRAAEMEQKIDFYRLNISDDDKKEMTELRECLAHFRNPEPINKVIWKVYYEKPTSDLIGRVIGAGTHTGIYKITNLTNGMCYVGQSV